jgi:hypothetical protein
MKIIKIKFVAFIMFGLSLCLMGCGGSSGSSDNDGTENSGSWYVSGFEWPHDGKPFESANCTVYSDADSEEAKQALAQLAEDVFGEIKQLFEIENNDIFLYPPGQDTIDIYAYKTYSPRSWGGWGYYGGILIFSLDHPDRQEWGHTKPEIYIPTLTHELMHVVESLLIGREITGLVDVWLTEGIAEAISGGTAGGRIMDLDQMNELLQKYGGSWNPISMHHYDYPDINGIIYYYYYPMFQLAVEYLVDIHGHGKTLIDLKNLFMDVSVGVPFVEAFEDRLEIGLLEYERRFFYLMNDYLQ